MSKIDPIFQVVSICTVILFSSITSANAAEPPKSKNKQPNHNFVMLESNIKQTEHLTPDNSTSNSINTVQQPKNSSSLISQTEKQIEESEPIESETEETEAEVLELDQFNPNPDLLFVPTTPEGVTIDITQPITLEQAVELGLRNNEDLREARLNVARSLKQLQEARAALYPTLNLRSDFGNSKTAQAENNIEDARISNEENPSFQRDVDDESTTSFNGSLNLNYEIYTGGERGANIRRAKRQVQFNELGFEVTLLEVIFAIKRDYYSLQDADSQVDIEQGAVEDATQTLRDAQLLEEAGLGTRFDVLQAEVELAQANQRLTSAKSAQAIARRQLVETLSLGEQVDIITADEITKAGIWEIPLENSILLAYSNRAELEQFLVNREISQAERQISLATIRPQLSIFGELDFFEVADDNVDITTGYSVGAVLQWTLFDGGAAIARARQSEVDIALAENNFARQRDVVRFEVEQAFFGLQANEENIGTAQRGVELAEESLRLARLRFQAGVGTQTDVIQAQTELTTARGNLLTAIVDYNQSFNQLQRAVTNIPDDQVDIPEVELEVPDVEVDRSESPYPQLEVPDSEVDTPESELEVPENQE